MLLKISILGGFLILLIIIVRLFAINKLPKRIFILLWDIVLLRLLIPFNLPFHYGIATFVNKIIDININFLSNSNNSVTQENTKEIAVDTTFSFLEKFKWTTAVWIVGMIIVLIAFGILYFKEYKKMQASLPVSKEIEDKFRSITPIPKRTKILFSERISTPLTLGILFPKIILPKILKSVDDIELKFVFAHEAIHIKRADNLRKIIMLIAISVHWFNPFVWIMYTFFNRDIELSCDEKVIQLWGEDTKKEYATTLVTLAEKQYYWSICSTGFGKNAIHERIMAIMKFKKPTITSIVCALILLGVSITVFASDIPINISVGTFRNKSGQDISVGTFSEINNEVEESSDYQSGYECF